MTKRNRFLSIFMVLVMALSALPIIPAIASPPDDFITIKGVNYNISLTTLNLSALELTDADIAPLSQMVNLETLHLSSNSITNITPISGLNKLTVLSLDQNNIVNISAINTLTNLTWLNLERNSIVIIANNATATTIIHGI